MSDKPPPRRRFQFRLRTLMIVVTLLAVPLGYVGWQAKIVRERKAMCERVWTVDRGECWVPSDSSRSPEQLKIPWIRRLLGDQEILAVVLPLNTDHEERRRISEVLPEAGIAWVIKVNGREVLKSFPD